MLIRSFLLFNFQGACRRFSEATLILYHFRNALSRGFQKFFEKFLTSSLKDIPLRVEAPPRFELGIRVLQTHALPLGYGAEIGADYEARTRYLHLGKVALYQMS